MNKERDDNDDISRSRYIRSNEQSDRRCRYHLIRPNSFYLKEKKRKEKNESQSIWKSSYLSPVQFFV